MLTRPPSLDTMSREALGHWIKAVVAVTVVSLLFIASYAGGLHEPRPHDVPLAVSSQVPASVARGIDASPVFRVTRVAGASAAVRLLDRREAYGAITAGSSGLRLTVAPAASVAIESLLRTELAPRLGPHGHPAPVQVVHPLPASDSRGLVAFYLAVGWAVGGYLGASLFGLRFGTSPTRRALLARFGGFAALGVLTGFFGALIATGIAGYDHGLLALSLIGFLTVAGVGLASTAFQSLIGVAGTSVAILLFVILGNPASGGPYATELLPGFWGTIGPLLPPGAATTAIQHAAYFPDASSASPLLVLSAWLIGGALVALRLAGHRQATTGETRERVEIGAAGTAAV
jgi:hypothetical protein